MTHNTFIVYMPGAGGNHLKNLLCLSPDFANHTELDVSVYDDTSRPPGEVWCVGGRNLQDIFFKRIFDNPGERSVLIAHFGELAQNRDKFLLVPDRRCVVVTMNNPAYRSVLDQRQLRLGQAIHPYWLDEELLWCYRSDMMLRYFGVQAQDCLEIDLADFWHTDMIHNGTLDRICDFVGTAVPKSAALELHHKWIKANFSGSI